MNKNSDQTLAIIFRDTWVSDFFNFKNVTSKSIKIIRVQLRSINKLQCKQNEFLFYK